MSRNNMKKNTVVSWQITGQNCRGTGLTISDEDEGGMILVRVNNLGDEPPLGYHPVISCTVTWLTPSK